MTDLRHGLLEALEAAEADLQDAVRRVEALDTLATFAAGHPGAHVSSFAQIEDRLEPKDRARFRNALADAAATDPTNPAGEAVDHKEKTTS